MNEQRPRQVTVAGWLIILGGIAVVVMAYQQMATLHSLATRESVESVLADPALKGAGLGVGGFLTLLHVLALVAAGCATACAVLGWHALRGSRSARIALSVLAVPLLFAGLGGGGLFSTVVAVAALMLWLPPAAQWFSGEPADGPEEPTTPRPDPRGQVPPANGPVSGPVSGPVPPPPPAYPSYPPASSPPAGSQPGGPAAQGPWPPSPGPGGAATGWGPPAGHPVPPPMGWPPPQWPGMPAYGAVTPRPQRRPGGVVAAVVLTWVFGLLAVLAMAATLIYILSERDTVWRNALRQNPRLGTDGITQNELIAMACVLVALTVMWCVTTSVVALFAWRGAPWARVTLIVLLAVTLAGLVVVSAFNLLFLLPTAAAIAAIVQLARPDARAWCQPRR